MKIKIMVVVLLTMTSIYFYNFNKEGLSTEGDRKSKQLAPQRDKTKTTSEKSANSTINGKPVPSGIYDIPRAQINAVYDGYDVFSVSELEQKIKDGDNVAARYLGSKLKHCNSLVNKLESINKMVGNNKLEVAEQRISSYDHHKELCDQASPQLKADWHKLFWLAADRGDVWAQLNISASFPKEMIEKSFRSPRILQEIVDRTRWAFTQAANSGFAPAISELGHSYYQGYLSEDNDSRLMAASYFKISIEAGILPPNQLAYLERDFNLLLSGFSDEELRRLDSVYQRNYVACCQ